MLFQIAPGNVERVARPPRGETPGLQKPAECWLQDLTDEEMAGLEAIVLPQNRPLVFVRGDSFDSVGDPWQKLNPAYVRAKVGRRFFSIDQAEVPNMPQVPYGQHWVCGGKACGHDQLPRRQAIPFGTWFEDGLQPWRFCYQLSTPGRYRIRPQRLRRSSRRASIFERATRRAARIATSCIPRWRT
jgi:hypothetical protein